MDYHSASFAQFHRSSRPPPYPQAADRNDALLSSSSSSSDPSLHIPRLFDPSPSFTFSALPQPRGRDPFHAGAGPGAVAALPGAAPLSSLSSYAAHHADLTPSYAAYQAASLAAAAGNRQYVVDPATYGGVQLAVPTDRTGQLAAINLNPAFWSSPKVKPPKIGGWKKKHPKKTKLVQSAYCGTCNVNCNSKDMLDQHKLGKKHMKNLEKLRGATNAATNAAPITSNGSCNPLIGPPENPDQHSKVLEQNVRKKAASEPAVDLETKRRRVVQGGAAADAVRTCTICNVVCNSDTVFMYHLTGQKHAAMLKKQAAGS